jgi:predicted nucleotidyltransferase
MGARRLEDLRREETAAPVAAPIAAIVEAARRRHGDAVAAVLFYGSCLRLGSDEDKIVDLYVLVEGYAAAYGRGLTAFWNWALPPNVFYLETPFEGRKVRAKYAVVSLADFTAGAGGGWFHPYLWARFAQPCRLAYARDAAAAESVLQALCGSLRKMLAEGRVLVGRDFTSRDLWVALLRRTYATELRAEPPERAAEIFDLDAAHYERVTAAVLPEFGVRPAAASQWTQAAQDRPEMKWMLRRLQGKLLSVLRLVKAAFTFQDGAQYLLWKIERHSGVTIEVTPWQRRHPVLASSVLFWKLYRKGAFR